MDNNKNNHAINIDFSVLLGAIAQLDTNSLHLFSKEVTKLLLKRIPKKQQEREWSLIYQIYTIVPPNIQQEYDELIVKLEDGTLSDKEREVFLSLNDQIEQFSADRLTLLIELAKVRGVTVKEVMIQLGIQKPVYA